MLINFNSRWQHIPEIELAHLHIFFEFILTQMNFPTRHNTFNVFALTFMIGSLCLSPWGPGGHCRLLDSKTNV